MLSEWVRATSWFRRVPSDGRAPERTRASAGTMPTDAKQGVKTPKSAERVETRTSTRCDRKGTPPRSAARFRRLKTASTSNGSAWSRRNITSGTKLGKVAFTDKFMSISTGSESPAAIKAMVDRAAERGWETVRLNRFTGVCPARMDCSNCARAEGCWPHTDRWATGKRRKGTGATCRSARMCRSASKARSKSIGRVQSAHAERVNDRRSGRQQSLADSVSWPPRSRRRSSMERYPPSFVARCGP
jgi:hypothetical protein